MKDTPVLSESQPINNTGLIPLDEGWAVQIHKGRSTALGFARLPAFDGKEVRTVSLLTPYATEIYTCLTILYVQAAVSCVGIYVANPRRRPKMGEVKFASFLRGIRVGLNVDEPLQLFSAREAPKDISHQEKFIGVQVMRRKAQRMKPRRSAAFVFAGSVFAGSMMLSLAGGGLIPRSFAGSNRNQEAQQSASASPTAKPVGTVKTISGNTITLATDAGSTLNILVQDSTRLVRIAPGQKDLKDAAPIQLQDVQAGDRILARGSASDDGKSITASSVVLIKEADLTAKQERDREDWQKRGVGGLVSKVDATNGTITLSAPAMTDAKPVTIHLSKSTIIRRYSPDSVKFDDAKPGTLDQINAGDQLRARGVRSPDGSELTADEIVSGVFRNIAGTVISTDPVGNTVTVMDLVTKKPVTLRITADSQLRKLPPPVAQRIAQRLRGQTPGGAPDASAPGGGPPAKAGPAAQGSGAAGGSRPGGPPDFQQMLKRMPAVTPADLQKGDAVMIVTTQGTTTTQPTAITLLSGVEPILSASPNGNQAAMLLSPWNLGGGGEAAGATQ
jgi:hypothetical protein